MHAKDSVGIGQPMSFAYDTSVRVSGKQTIFRMSGWVGKQYCVKYTQYLHSKYRRQSRRKVLRENEQKMFSWANELFQFSLTMSRQTVGLS